MAKKVVPKRVRIRRLKKKADKLLQDYYRSLENLCVVCGALSNVMHHHVPVSRSNYLRYSEKNLVHLCQGCHLQHHCGNPTISYKYRQHINEEELLKVQHEYKKFTEEELQEICERYKT